MSDSNPVSNNAQTVITEVDARGVATVTLNRPEKHNAFDDAMIAKLSETFASIARDDAVRVMVLAANGKSFSAGGDLGWMKRSANYSHQQNLDDAKTLATMLHSINTLPKPTIARVHSAAFGGAVGLISCCDIAIATSAAKFSLSEVKIGLIPATISPYVIAAIGPRAARRLFITAERFDAQLALSLGLLSTVVEDQAALDDSVNAFIDQLLGNGPKAMAAAKALVFDMNRPIDDALIEESCRRIADARASDEGQEGLGAFLEKRAPAWIQNLK